MASAAAAIPFGWHSPGRVSFSYELDNPAVAPPPPEADPPATSVGKDFIDFEFRLDDSAAMLPADELFANGKLLPLLPAPAPATPVAVKEAAPPEPVRAMRAAVAEPLDPYAFSPKAPSCSTRWRELLGLRRSQTPKANPAATTGGDAGSRNLRPRSLKLLMHQNPRSAAVAAAATDSSVLTLPLLRDSDAESLSISSRLSLSSSSSSSCHEHDDSFPASARHSVDITDLKHSASGATPPRIRLIRHRRSDNIASFTAAAASCAGRSPTRRPATAPPPRGVSVDSPRMNASGKVVFERSSSSPAGDIGGSGGVRPRSSVDRSYSAHVAPVLNVPVCSLRGGATAGVFGGLFGPQRKEKDASGGRGPSPARSRPSARRSTAAAAAARAPAVGC